MDPKGLNEPIAVLLSVAACYSVPRADNTKVIGNSEMYSSKQKRDEGIDAVKRHVGEAEVRDET